MGAAADLRRLGVGGLIGARRAGVAASAAVKMEE
mgnify:CR=1 FL=1